MGLFDIAKAVGKEVVGQMQHKQEEVMRYKERMEYLDDETLKRRAKSGDQNQRYAALMLLKERGYTSNDL